MQDSQNYFALSYLGGGVNFKDMALWRWDKNVNNDRIVFTRSKTERKDNQQPQSIALSGRIAEILAEYHYTPGYVLPVIFSTNQRTMGHQIKGALKRINKDLKEIAKIAGVPNPDQITFYVARHTFATVLKTSGHSVEMIKELLGHEDIKTTQIYLGSFDDATKDAAFEDLL
jgi:integrase